MSPATNISHRMEGIPQMTPTPPPATPAPPPAAQAQKGLNLSSKQVVGLFLSVLGVIVLLTLVLAFHYSKASDTTSVLGVAIPALTAIIGAALGSGAGNAVGSAGKAGVQQQLTQAVNTATAAKSQVAALNEHIVPLFASLKQNLPSPAGENRLMLASAVGGTAGDQGINTANLDAVTTALGRLDGLLQGVPTNDDTNGPLAE